ncbi:hypothetical protein ONZ45_g11751 [Pleurotus djamor]|nr:hypothetical protein ONZ45_g11751 [Pleurotus djamor]
MAPRCLAMCGAKQRPIVAFLEPQTACYPSRIRKSLRTVLSIPVLQRWAKDKVLSFVPPDGHFTLFEYRYVPGASSTSAARFASPTTSGSPAVASGKDIVPLPISLKHSFELTETTCSFDINVTSRLTTKGVENFVAELYVGEGMSAFKCTVGRSSGGFSNTSARGIGSDSHGGGSGGASWSLDTKKRMGDTNNNAVE